MKRLILIGVLLAGNVLAEDARQLATLPLAAQESLREEMLDNLIQLNEILGLIAAGKVKEAGVLAESSLGVASMGRHRAKPVDARPGPHMPPAMHGIGMDGHKAVSEFARVAASGDRDKAMALLPNLTSACVGCHAAYRTR